MPDSSWPNQMSETSAKRFAIKQKHIAGGYAFTNIIKVESKLDDAIHLLEHHFDCFDAIDETIDLNKWSTYFAFDAVGLVTFSKEFGFLCQAADVGGSIATSQNLVAYLSAMAYFHRYHDALMSMLTFSWIDLQPMKHVMNTTLHAVQIREKSSVESVDMMEQWKAAHERHPEGISKKDILSTANANVAAGADTVSTAFQAFIYLMLRNPKCVQRLRMELDKAALVGRTSLAVPFATAQRLPYFQACVSLTSSSERLS